MIFLKLGERSLFFPMLLEGNTGCQDAEQKAGHYSRDISLKDISSGYYQLMLKTPSQYLSRSSCAEINGIKNALRLAIFLQRYLPRM